MSNSIRPNQLADALADQLTIYHQDVTERVDAAGLKAIKALVKRTKAAAPKRSGDLQKHIAWQAVQDQRTGTKQFVWHVKAPDYRIVHLVVHGHATRTGGRTKGNPFLQNALDAILPEYEKEVEEALKND